MIEPFKKQVPVSLQIVLLMEQYIRDNSKLVETYPADVTLTTEYNRLCKLGLGNTKNAQIIKQKLDLIEGSRRVKERANNLIFFIKSLREHFGETTMLIGTKQFNDLLKKYRLKTGLLSDYTGVVPDKNIRELANVVDKIPSFEHHLNFDNEYLWYVVECINMASGSDAEQIFNDLVGWIRDNRIIKTNTPMLRWDNTLSVNNIITDSSFPFTVLQYRYNNLFKIRVKNDEPLDKRTLFIACPASQLEGQPLKITKKAIDPIVFQYSPYGVVIHSIWGEEAEDKVFEEYKKVNQLLGI